MKEEEPREFGGGGSLDSGLLEYQQTTDVWRQNIHMMGFEETGIYPAVYTDFLHTALYQGTDELLPGMSLGDFYQQSKKHPDQKQNSAAKCPCSKQDQIKIRQEPRSKTLLHRFFKEQSYNSSKAQFRDLCYSDNHICSKRHLLFFHVLGKGLGQEMCWWPTNWGWAC